MPALRSDAMTDQATATYDDLVPAGVAAPSLADIITLLPEAGQVYVNVALVRWQLQAEQAAHAQTRVQLQIARAALLQAGIDPLTLQPKGAPEVGTGDHN